LDCSSLPICDDFESDPMGAAPAASGWALEYGWNPILETGEEAFIQVSAADAHSPGQSVLVDSTAGSGGENAPWSFAYESPTEPFYARAWYNVVDLGPGNAVLMAVGPDHNDEIRLRFHEGVITLNSASGDGLAPDPFNCTTDCVDAIVGEWFCAELFYDSASQTARLWIDENLAAEVVGNVGWHSSGNFPTATRIWFGVLGLNGGAPKTFIDDVAVGPDRIGCN
jgi:hypothetical protein